MKGIYRLNFDCGRMGNLHGLFIADSADVKALVESEKEIYFGEVLGKHSEIRGSIGSEEITLVTDEILPVEIFEKYNLSSGYDPFDYIEEDNDD